MDILFRIGCGLLVLFVCFVAYWLLTDDDSDDA